MKIRDSKDNAVVRFQPNAAANFEVIRLKIMARSARNFGCMNINELIKARTAAPSSYRGAADRWRRP